MDRNNKTFYNPNNSNRTGGNPHGGYDGGRRQHGYGDRNNSQGREIKQNVFGGNLGLLFTRRYFNGLTAEHLEDKDLQKTYYTERNNSVIRHSKNFENPKERLEEIPGTPPIELTVAYPGLLAGTGIFHSTGHFGETKLGFSFDHTTGLPYLPGSSVKGLLRSVFPMCGEDVKKEREDYIKEKLKDKVADISLIDIYDLELNIFGSDNKDKKLRKKGCDIFFDAFPTESGKHGLLGLDYITPHNDEFSNPTPIQFMRIEPGVSFCFSFRLSDFKDGENVLVDKNAKRELFKAILLDIGIGAKTNVGYGQFKRD